MDAAILQQFRTLLEHRRFELLVPLARADEEARADTGGPTDIGEQSTRTISREFLFAQADANRRMLRRVEDALRRIREGAYGECEHCGGTISLARLKAIPWAKYCIRCQEELESDRQHIAA